MSWPRLRRFALALPLALVAVGVLLLVNEAGFSRSQQAVQALRQSHAAQEALDQLMQGLLNAESGQRGYLLTQDERYLQPYEGAILAIQSHLDALRNAQPAPAHQQDFDQLVQLVARKLSEMELTVQMRRKDNDEGWRFVLSTDVGQQDMDAIRKLVVRMSGRSAQQVERGDADIHEALAWSRIGITLVALAALLAFHLYLRNSQALRAAHEREQQVLERERERLEQLVRERTASLSELAHHLQQVREDERAHLARELHDELGALLTAAKLDVARLKPRMDPDSPESAERLQHLTDTLNSGIALKRRIIEDLRPSSLDNLGLVASLEILTREFSERSGIAVQARLEPVQLPASAQLTVYRLVQEALTNVLKHAQARTVVVSLNAYPGHVCVQVRDDGCGFDAQAGAAPPRAHGLLGMRHRVNAEGGQLTVSATPGQGTLVSARLPLAQAAADR